MKITTAALAVLLLAGCSAQQSAQITSTSLSPAALAQLQQTCTAAQPILAAASASDSPASVSSIAAYGTAFCGQLQAGTTPATADANSQSWLQGVLNAVQIAAQVVGKIMPIVALF